jgi:hypothetical protein
MTDNEPATQTQINRLYAVLHSLNINPKDFKKDQHISNLEELTRRQISDWIDTLEADEAAAKDTPEKNGRQYKRSHLPCRYLHETSTDRR